MAFRLKYSQIGPGFLAGLRVRTLLEVEFWCHLNNRWHGTRMSRYGARHRPHTCPDQGAVTGREGESKEMLTFGSIEGIWVANERKCHDTRVNIIPHISAVQASVAVKLLRHIANMHI